MTIIGNFSLPTAQRTSQLINDTRFSSIREYVLSASLFKDTDVIEITDLTPSSLIYRADIIVTSPFTTLDGKQHSISVVDMENTILFDSTWNDPNIIGTYTTNCYVGITTVNAKLKVLHDLREATGGNAILRLYLYNNIDEYIKLLTSDGLYYHTEDIVGIDVVK